MSSAQRNINSTPSPRIPPELRYCAESDILFIDLPNDSQPITLVQPIQLTAAARIAPDGRIVGLMLRSLAQMGKERL
jgi:hypothetical protein